jgi:ZIP family zinc transporter
VLEAGLWGLVGGAALLVGAVAGLRLKASDRVIGLVMGFGAGVLISAVAFELTAEAYNRSGEEAVVGGLALGALTFYLGDRWLDRKGGEGRKRSDGRQAGGAAMGIVLGALLDGIPESVAIGTSLLSGDDVSFAFVLAVFISNVPEAFSASPGLRSAGYSDRWIVRLWLGVLAVSALAAALGYGLLGGASEDVLAGIQAFAAGAILTMLADTMMPEAFKEGGAKVGLVTVLGFALSFLLSTLD